MNMSAKDFLDFLRHKKIQFVQQESEGMIIFFVYNYEIPFGKYRGKIVHIGMPIPKDFPSVAPYGLHVKKDHGIQENISNVNLSPIGEDWEFWSREICWESQYRTPQFYFDNVNRWLEIV